MKKPNPLLKVLAAIPEKPEDAPTSFLPERLVMVDCEMTGVDESKHKLLQAAFVKLQLANGQYEEVGEPLVLYMKHDGRPDNEFQHKFLTPVFDRCNESELEGPEAREQLHAWMGDWKGEVTPTGDCVPTDIAFLKAAGVVERGDIVDEKPVPGTFHYEFFDLNAPKAFARHKVREKYAVADLDDGIHDALVDCRNQTKELNSYIPILCPEYFAEASKVQATEDKGITDADTEFFSQGYCWILAQELAKSGMELAVLRGYHEPDEPFYPHAFVIDGNKAVDIEGRRDIEKLRAQWSGVWKKPLEVIRGEEAKELFKNVKPNAHAEQEAKRVIKENPKLFGKRSTTAGKMKELFYEKQSLAAFDQMVEVNGKQVEVFKNPSRAEMKEIQKHDEVRGFLSVNDLYVWNPMEGIHAQVREGLEDKIPDDSVSLLMGVHSDGKCYWVTVTDWTKGSSYYHNPNIKDYILNHSALKLVRDRKEFEIGYFDDAIVGDWAEMGAEETAAAVERIDIESFTELKEELHQEKLHHPEGFVLPEWLTEGATRSVPPEEVATARTPDGQLVGWAGVGLFTLIGEKEPKGMLQLYVDEKERGAGVAKKLAAEAVALFKETHQDIEDVLYSEEFAAGFDVIEDAGLYAEPFVGRSAKSRPQLEANLVKASSMKKRRIKAADDILPEDLPPAVQPAEGDDGQLPEEKKALVLEFQKKSLRADSFQDFQELLNQIMLEVQLTENYRVSVAGLLNEYRVAEGYVAL